MENNAPSAPSMPVNKEEKIPQSNPSKLDYYAKTGSKVLDFFLGFFGGIVLSVFLGFLSFNLPSLAIFNSFNSLFFLAIFVLLIIFFFRKGRRFIAIGMIAISLIPLLAFGSCLLILASYR